MCNCVSQAKFQSEDDASFEDLAVKMREAHRRKYWWVYEHPMIESGKEALYLLQNGEMMSEEDRKKRDEVRHTHTYTYICTLSLLRVCWEGVFRLGQPCPQVPANLVPPCS